MHGDARHAAAGGRQQQRSRRLSNQWRGPEATCAARFRVSWTPPPPDPSPRRGQQTDGGCPRRRTSRLSRPIIERFSSGPSEKSDEPKAKRRCVALCCAGCGNLLGRTVRFSNEHIQYASKGEALKFSDQARTTVPGLRVVYMVYRTCPKCLDGNYSRI
jgi:hypothetical protein